MRDKWNRPQSGSTYGMITIEKAIANATEIYKPGGKRSSATTTMPNFSGIIYPYLTAPNCSLLVFDHSCVFYSTISTYTSV